MKQIAEAFNDMNRARSVWRYLSLCATMVTALPAQTFTTLHNFEVGRGANPNAGLVQGADGNFYGTTLEGGAHNDGTVFRITPSGSLTRLYEFCAVARCPDGAEPYGGLVQGADGNFYGTTYAGGAGGGTVFKITPAGTLTTLHKFCSKPQCADGSSPYSSLVRAVNGGEIYGTTLRGGADGNGGTVFKITPTGTLTTLYSFCRQQGVSCPDGVFPYATLFEPGSGEFFGTTGFGGASGGGSLQGGTIFKMTPSGSLTTLYSFCAQNGCIDGELPDGSLIRDSDGNFYGTTAEGGSSSGGTVFKITPTGTLTTLYSFCSRNNCADGASPSAGLSLGAEGGLYGTTSGGGANGNYGTVFKITTSGVLTTLHSFNRDDGEGPVGQLVQGSDGDFYGTTIKGGANGYGTVFRLSLGRSPFVIPHPSAGRVGHTVQILGTNLTGATSVSFNGAAAVFQVVSSSEITATVPAGANKGRLQVVTPVGTLTSNVAFLVLP